MKLALYQLFLVDHHVVTQVIETELIVCNIRDIAVVLRTPLLGFHGLQHAADCQAQEPVYFPHPVRVAVGQVIIDRDDADTASLQSVQIGRQRTDEGLAFTGLHLCDTALMQNHAADQLYTEMLHPQHTSRGFTDDSVRFRKNVVECLALCQALFELRSLCCELLITQFDHGRS